MDHRHARIVQWNTDGTHTINTYDSPFDPHPREEGQGTDKTQWGGGQYLFSDNESKKSNKKISQEQEYYKTLEHMLSEFDNILLTGPTTAKNELFNRILKNKLFGGKRVGVENADKMTDKELTDLMERYFENNGERK